MGIRLSDVKNNSRNVVVPFGEYEVNVKYRPQAMTAVEEDVFQKMLTDESYVNACVQLILDIVIEWDVLDDDDQPLLITAEICRETLPVRFLREIVKVVMSDMYPKEENVSSFVGTS